MARLTEKQKRFVAEYLVDLNATQAAIRAGYSEKTAGQIGEQNLKKLEIQTALQEAMNERSKRTEITQDMVLAELAAIAFANGTDYATVSSNGLVRIVPTSELSTGQKKAIACIKEGQYGTEVKQYDKLRALEMLGKHLGMFDARAAHQQEQENNLVEQLLGGTGEDIDTDDLSEIE